MIVEKQLVLEMLVGESLKMIVDESLDIIVYESLDMIVDESLMVEDKSLVKLMDETLKLDEEHFEFVIADCRLGHLTVAAEYFFNNDLEYLKSTYSEKKYSTSITKMKATRYELVGIEDMIPKQWSRAKRILSVVSVTINKLYGYGHLEEITVRRVYRQLYKFKEGDFVDLHLNDIEDMLLLVVQHKLFNRNGNEIVDLVVALRMFIRSLFIKRSVEDVQLELYTPSFDPPRVIYEVLNKQNRVMRADELYKFSDGTLKTVRDELHHRLLNFHFGYNKAMSRRKWSCTDKRRSGLMVDLIDKQMLERRIILNLERLVGARELEMDYRLMQRTV
ncbi:hypothetical protein Tco_0184627 [Tanacetum coccineum]